MNRVIKFRVWHQNKMWPASIGDDGHVCIWRDDAEEIGNHCIGHCHESNGILKPVENLMQFTGLKDKNGIEIYEGDLVRLTFPNLKIFKDENSFIFNTLIKPELKENHYIGKVKGDYEEGILSQFSYYIGNVPFFRLKSWVGNNGIEVIGNIFENKA